MVKSLPKQPAAGATKAKGKGKAPSSGEITRLASLLPPSAPLNADLNPLAYLIALFRSLPVTRTPSTLEKQEQNRQQVHAAFHALKATFETLLNAGRIHGVLKSVAQKKPKYDGAAEGDAEEKGIQAVKVWLQTQFSAYLSHAALVATSHWDLAVRHSALSALLSLHRTESLFLTALQPNKQAKWGTLVWEQLVKALVLPESEGGLLAEETREEWRKWWDKCDDVRYYFLKQSATLIASYQSPPPPQIAINLLAILESLSTMPTAASELNEWFCSPPLTLKPPTSSTITAATKKRKAASQPVPDGSTGVFDSDSSSSEEEDEGQKLSSVQRKKLVPPLLSLAAHRKVFQDAWLAVLGLELREEDAKKVLERLHRQVLGHMTDPRRLMDWLSDCTDAGPPFSLLLTRGETLKEDNAGGTSAILALNGLFTLITKHNLEYPDFFTKLYALLDRSVLHVRYRARFFRLLEIFMSSSHLPSTIIASFIKRLARLAISAPPAASVTVLPFIYNLLKLHPSCMPLIHRPSGDIDVPLPVMSTDPFNEKEIDPLKSNAISSSLWEIATLQKHYSASVSGLAKVFNEVMAKQAYTMEDFLDHSYGTMFESEMQRKIKTAALAPVPKRQPIGDSFFPALGSVNAVSGAEKGEDGAEAEGEEGGSGGEQEAVDIVSRLWTF